MKSNKTIQIKKYLLPFSWLYGFIVYLRNKFFDWKIFKQEEYSVPVICVGNITVGGTGKTPHIEFLIKILENKFRVAVISRGYKRKTSGFVLSTSQSTSSEIGDEPYQIKKKYPNVILAVDSDRRRGIKKLLKLDNPPQVILMDDGFQHRYVKPSYVILLSNYNRPIYEDTLLPAGHLREPIKAISRANMILVTKCPDTLQPIDYRIITHDIPTLAYQNLYFTSFIYKQLIPVFNNGAKKRDLSYLHDKHILLVTGIASPKMILEKLSEYTNKVESIIYPDHYSFKKSDIKRIVDKYESIESKNKVIVVTEKDAARLQRSEDNIGKSIKNMLYYLPVEIIFSEEEDERHFKHKIYEHIRKYSRNG